MVQILFLVLKIIGILVLVLLGLALGGILCLLFVPVRYRISGAFKGQLQADFKASWLLSILSLCVTYREASMEAKLKLFGLTLWPGKEKDRDTEDADGFEDGREEILPPTEAFHQETEGPEDEQIPRQAEGERLGNRRPDRPPRLNRWKGLIPFAG